MRIISDTIDKVEEFSKHTVKVLISGYGFPQVKQMLKMAMETQLENEIEQKYKVVELQDDKNDILQKFNEIRGGYLVDIDDVFDYELPRQDVSSLKKKIRYCKNPMERKMLQQELNALYKEQKKK